MPKRIGVSSSESLPAPPRDFRLYLQEELVRRSRNNPRYSLRAFARSLRCDVSTLGKILRGRRPLGKLAITRLALRLGLSPEETEPFLAKKKGSGPVPGTAAYHVLPLDAFRVICDWYHYAILELMRVEGFRSDPRWVGRVLGISPSEVSIAVERLARVGAIEIRPDGSWKDISGGAQTSCEAPFADEAFRRLQIQVLEKAIAAVRETPIERRDQSSMTMAIDPSKLGEAKERITRFRRELAAFLSRGDRETEVYNLSISLYPLTQLTENPEAP